MKLLKNVSMPFLKNIYWKKKVLLEKFYNIIKAWENLSLIL